MTRPNRTMAVAPSWVEAHCIVPDGFRAGQSFRLYDFQLTYFANFYLVRGEYACPHGAGTLGFRSDGTERAGRQCP